MAEELDEGKNGEDSPGTEEVKEPDIKWLILFGLIVVCVMAILLYATYIMYATETQDSFCGSDEIRFERGCCLDENNNSICDKHELGDGCYVEHGVEYCR